MAIPSTCALISGGLDSAVLLRRLLGRGHVLPLYVRCGFVWEPAEMHWLRRLLRALRTPALRSLRVVDLPARPFYGPHWSLTGRRVPGAHSRDAAVYLPGRNALLLTAGAIVAARERASTVALGVLRGNPFGDATPRFFSTMSSALSQALGRNIRIIAPLRGMHKAQLICADAAAPWALTFSCLNPRAGAHHCGRCNKCAERRRAFRLAGITDPTRYAR